MRKNNSMLSFNHDTLILISNSSLLSPTLYLWYLFGEFGIRSMNYPLITLSTWYCINIVRWNSALVTPRELEEKVIFDWEVEDRLREYFTLLSCQHHFHMKLKYHCVSLAEVPRVHLCTISLKLLLTLELLIHTVTKNEKDNHLWNLNKLYKVFSSYLHGYISLCIVCLCHS